MEVLTRLLVKVTHWHPFNGVDLVGDWFDPYFRHVINEECNRQELQIPFDQRKDLL